MMQHTKPFKFQPRYLPGFIYLVHAKGTNKFKIGRTIDVLTRVKDLQTGCPLTIRYVYHAYVGNMSSCEQDLHRKFATKREIGEWFSLTREDVELCIFFMRLLQEPQPPSSPVFVKELSPVAQEGKSKELGKIIDQMKSHGCSKERIILQLWGVSKGGSPKYKAAEAEYKRVVGEA
jgi:hypothetical protein